MTEIAEINNSDDLTVKSETLEPKPPMPADSISEAADAFLLKLDALLETVNRIMFIIVRSRERAQKELDEYLEPFPEQADGTVSFIVGSAEYRKYLNFSEAREKAVEARRIVPQSFLVSMVSQYDAFLATAIRNLFLLKPEKLRTGDKSISVKELIRFSSIEELIEELIDDEIDEVLRGSHLSQIEWIAKKFDFSIDAKDPLIEKFIEVTERRNVCVHADGKISKQYRDRTQKISKDLVASTELGQPLSISRSYIKNARNTLFETGIRAIQIAWRKIRPDQSEEQDKLLINVIFELLSRQDFLLARNISDFGAGLRDIADETNRRTMCINRAQAYKWSGKNEEAKKIVSGLDWSASSAHFKLAVAVINDDYSEATKLMPVVPNEGRDGITEDGYRLWPLFREIRSAPIFQEAFQKKFGAPLLSKQVHVSPKDVHGEIAQPQPSPDTEDDSKTTS